MLKLAEHNFELKVPKTSLIMSSNYQQICGYKCRKVITGSEMTLGGYLVMARSPLLTSLLVAR